MDPRFVSKCQMCQRTINVNNMVHPDYGFVRFDEHGICKDKLAVFDVCQDCLTKIIKVVTSLTMY